MSLVEFLGFNISEGKIIYYGVFIVFRKDVLGRLVFNKNGLRWGRVI